MFMASGLKQAKAAEPGPAAKKPQQKKKAKKRPSDDDDVTRAADIISSDDDFAFDALDDIDSGFVPAYCCRILLVSKDRYACC